MFEGLGLLGNAAILIISLVVLTKFSDLTIDNSVKFAEISGLGKTTVGFVLVSFSTSLPELSVSVFAAIGQGTVGVSIGNVLGSNIVNICLILGICFLLLTLNNSHKTYSIPFISRAEIKDLYFGLFIASMIPLVLIYLGYASRFIGILLVAIFLYYNLRLLKRNESQKTTSEDKNRKKLSKTVSMVLIGAAGVVASAYFIIESASYIAISIGVPSVVIGATIVAFGTSLPELVTSIDATKKGHVELALGNIIGSGFINTTLVLGVALMGSELRINMAAFSNLVVFSIITNLLLWYFLSGEEISRREGSVLLFMYFLFLATNFGVLTF